MVKNYRHVFRQKNIRFRATGTNYLRFFIAALAMVMCNVQAGTASEGNIADPYFMSNGVLLIPTDGVRSNVPTCATESARFAINGSTDAGKVQAAAVMAAFAMGKKVVFWGTGTCSAWGDTETVDFLRVVG